MKVALAVVALTHLFASAEAAFLEPAQDALTSFSHDKLQSLNDLPTDVAHTIARGFDSRDLALLAMVDRSSHSSLSKHLNQFRGLGSIADKCGLAHSLDLFRPELSTSLFGRDPITHTCISFLLGQQCLGDTNQALCNSKNTVVPLQVLNASLYHVYYAPALPNPSFVPVFIDFMRHKRHIHRLSIRFIEGDESYFQLLHGLADVAIDHLALEFPTPDPPRDWFSQLEKLKPLKKLSIYSPCLLKEPFQALVDVIRHLSLLSLVIDVGCSRNIQNLANPTIESLELRSEPPLSWDILKFPKLSSLSIHGAPLVGLDLDSWIPVFNKIKSFTLGRHKRNHLLELDLLSLLLIHHKKTLESLSLWSLDPKTPAGDFFDAFFYQNNVLKAFETTDPRALPFLGNATNLDSFGYTLLVYSNPTPPKDELANLLMFISTSSIKRLSIELRIFDVNLEVLHAIALSTRRNAALLEIQLTLVFGEYLSHGKTLGLVLGSFVEKLRDGVRVNGVEKTKILERLATSKRMDYLDPFMHRSGYRVGSDIPMFYS